MSRFIHIDHAFLFGSYVNGHAREDSDIDLAVFSDDFKRFSLLERLDLLSRTVMAVDARIEVHAFTKEDYDRASEASFVRIVKDTGILV